MHRGAMKSGICRTETLQILTIRDDQSKVKYTEMQYCRSQYADTSKVKQNMQNINTADTNMQRRGKQGKIYGTDLLQI